MSSRRIALHLLVLALAFSGVRAPHAFATAADGADRAAIEGVLGRTGLLADPFSSAGEPATFGTQRVTQRLHASPPSLRFAFGGADASGRPTRATVTIQRWVEGALEIRERNARGRDQIVRKALRDSCVRQVELRRVPAGAGGETAWRVGSVSALVGTTPASSAALPLVNLHTHAVSGGFLSVLSDLDELAVQPGNCAVTAPGDSVRVFVGGLAADAAVCVFVGDQRVAARRRDASHAEATVRVDGTGLAQIGVTVYSGRTLADAASPADSRTWVLPILVGTPPPPSQEFFALD